jgi:predicted nucleic acid-binding protein
MDGRKLLILDTNILLHACSANGEFHKGLPNRSGLETQQQAIGICPQKLRGQICQLAQNKTLVVPKIIEEELKDQQQNPKLNNRNKELLNNLLNVIKQRVVSLMIEPSHLKLQKRVMDQIREEAFKEVKRIERLYKGDTENWEHRRKEKHENPAINEIYKNPVCRTWAKLERHEDAINQSAGGVKHPPFLLNDFYIVLLAEKLKATIHSFDVDIKSLMGNLQKVIRKEDPTHRTTLQNDDIKRGNIN